MRKAVVVVLLLGLCLWGLLTVREMIEKPLVEMSLADLLEIVLIGSLAYLAGAWGMRVWDDR